MEKLFASAVLFLVFVLLIKFIETRFSSGKRVFPRPYQYGKKQSILTPSELVFYNTLGHAVGHEYRIVPQAHLSAFIDHEITGQSWKGAFARINGKSVDFLLCNKETMEPVLAIELDDSSHSRPDRKLRDDFVKEVFADAHMPFLRIDDMNISVEDLKSKVEGGLLGRWKQQRDRFF